ncbi:unnamed protein product [Urochloa humidicola]
MWGRRAHDERHQRVARLLFHSDTWSIRSQSRKVIPVRSLNLSTLAPRGSGVHRPPERNGRRLLAAGGLPYNLWHAFTDVLVPLFTRRRRRSPDTSRFSPPMDRQEARFVAGLCSVAQTRKPIH